MNYLVSSMIPEGWNKHDRDRFLHLVKFYIWDDPYLFKHCFDQIVRRYAPDHDMRRILSFCHDLVYVKGVTFILLLYQIYQYLESHNNIKKSDD